MVDHIAGETPPRVFISYARADGEQFANEVRQLLEEQNIPLWQDRANMEGGRDWWLQIVEALDSVEFMVMIMTPAALSSPIVRKEWRYARQQGVCIYPIRATSDLNFQDVPHWMSSVHWYDLAVEQTKFLRDLSRTCEKRYVPFMVGDLPDYFVPRPREFDQLRAKLLNEKRDEPIAITAALRGAGGYGKTTMAQALCHNEAIQEAFDDGILWVTLGEQPTNLIGIVGDLIYALSREKPTFETLAAATGRLSELLADRDILLVVDDVWDAEHLKPFLQGGKRCARLVTTRKEQVVPAYVEYIIVDAMQSDEAVDLLLYGLEHASSPADIRAVQKMVKRLGEWPLLLKLVNATLRARVKTHHQSLSGALRSINTILDKRGLVAFDAHNPQSRHQAVVTTLSISFDLLSTNENERYRELSIFPEDVDIPLTTLQHLWSAAGGLDEIDIEELCQKLYAISLLLDYNLTTRTIRLHDVIRAYLRDEVRETLPALNQRFLAAYHCAHWSDLPLNEHYLWSHLAEHLIDAEQVPELITTLRDGNYLVTKTYLLQAYAVETDISQAEQHNSTDPELSLLKHIYRGLGHVFNQCTTRHELASTLQAYLAAYPELIDVSVSIEQKLARPYLIAQYPLPGGPSPLLIRTLYSHTDGVNGCAVSPDGQWIVSCSGDKSLKVWDARSGKECMTLEGHTDWVSGCTISPSGDWIVSCSDDQTLKVWNAYTGGLRMTLEGHTGGVNGCAVSPDEQWIVSCSDDQTLKVWDAQTGKMRLTLEGHTGEVNGCAVSLDGQWIVSCSDDKTLKIWDAQTGELRMTLEGHTDEVNGCTVSPDGQWLVSCSGDQTLKVWNAQTGELRMTLEGHTNGVSRCAVSPAGDWLVSCSWDRTLKVWDARTGKERVTLVGHSSGVNDCAVSPTGDWIVSCSDDKTLRMWDASIAGKERITLAGYSSGVNDCAISPSGDWVVSCSDDKTLKIWDVSTGKERITLAGHSSYVEGCAISTKGDWIVSCSHDGTLKIWDAHTGKERMTLVGHRSYVEGCSISPAGDWIVSCSWDEMLKVWDAHTGKERMTLAGHSSYVKGCAVSPAGDWIVSCSNDGTLKIWDAHTGKERMTLEGHSGGVSGCAVSPAGDWILSCSWDKTLKLWDAHTGKERMTLEGHTDWVRGCAISPDGKWVVSCSNDGTLRMWDVSTGILQASLRVDAPLWACAIAPDGEHIVAGGSSGVYFLRNEVLTSFQDQLL
jgi:WD40 repeat protein